MWKSFEPTLNATNTHHQGNAVMEEYNTANFNYDRKLWINCTSLHSASYPCLFPIDTKPSYQEWSRWHPLVVLKIWPFLGNHHAVYKVVLVNLFVHWYRPWHSVLTMTLGTDHDTRYWPWHSVLTMTLGGLGEVSTLVLTMTLGGLGEVNTLVLTMTLLEGGGGGLLL